MKVVLSVLLAVSIFGNVSAQSFKRCPRETSKEFISRTIPKKAELKYVTETPEWAKNSKALLFFYALPLEGKVGINGTEKQDLVGTLLLPTGKLKYQQVFIDTFANYRNPKIEAVFFCNADLDLEKEVAVLFSFEMDPRITKCTGTGYETYFYKKPALKTQAKKLARITNLGNFYGCDCSCMRNHVETAQFKTPDDVMLELKKLGF